MIFVALGTQDRSFKRLLDAVQRQIDLGNIKERVVVQAGETKYTSDQMEIFDLISTDQFQKLLKECRVLITHGGVGTIVEALKCHKKIIAAARLSEYGEHQNNHQKQIISEFTKKHYILELDDFDKLDEKLKEIEHFVPKEYQSHTASFAKEVEGYITQSVGQGRGDLFRSFMYYSFFAFFAILLETIFALVFHVKMSFLSLLFFSFFLMYAYRLLMHFCFSLPKYQFFNELLFFAICLFVFAVFFFFEPVFLSHAVLGVFLSGFLVFLLTLLFALLGPLKEI